MEFERSAVLKAMLVAVVAGILLLTVLVDPVDRPTYQLHVQLRSGSDFLMLDVRDLQPESTSSASHHTLI